MILARVTFVPIVHEPPIISISRNKEILQSLQFSLTCIRLPAALLHEALSPDIPTIFVVRFDFLQVDYVLVIEWVRQLLNVSIRVVNSYVRFVLGLCVLVFWLEESNIVETERIVSIGDVVGTPWGRLKALKNLSRHYFIDYGWKLVNFVKHYHF